MDKKQVKVWALAAALMLAFNISAVQAQGAPVTPSAPTQPAKKGHKKPVKKVVKKAGKPAKKPVKKAGKKDGKKPAVKAPYPAKAKTAMTRAH